MSRVVAIALAALLLAGAWVLEAPVSADPDPAVVDTAAAEDETGPASRFSHCAWSYADGDIDTTFAVASVAETEYQLAFPAGGELVAQEPELLGRDSAVAISLSSIRAAGDAPVIVEFSDGPSAAAVVGQGDTELAAAACPSTLPKIWSLPGGSTEPGLELVVRLMNPFADDARVAIRATSELGAEALPGFDNVTVPPRASRVVLLHEEIPGRTNVALAIEQLEGSVIPMAELGDESDIAVWPATRQSETWEFPLTGLDSGLEPTEATLALANDALVDVSYSIDVFGEDGTVSEGPAGIIPGPGTVSIPLATLEMDGRFGLRVESEGPIGGAVRMVGDATRAATPGLPGVSDRWLMPGPNADATARYRMWVLNSGVEDVAVTYSFLNSVGDPLAAVENIVPGTSLASFPANEIGSSAILVRASAPISVAFSAEFSGAIAAGQGVPIGE